MTQPRVTQDVLNRLAEEYYNNEDIKDRHLENLVQIREIQKVLKYLGPGARILEMGVGDSVVTPELLAAGHKTDLVEGSPVLVARAKEKYPQLAIFHSMFEDFQPEQPYDIVLAFHVLEHVENVPHVLKQVHKWLKPGGKIIAIVPNAESIHRQLALHMGLIASLDELSGRDGLVGHLRVYTLDRLKTDFESAGFRVTDTFGNFLKTLPNSMLLDYSDELLRALCDIDLLPPRLLANIGLCAARE